MLSYPATWGPCDLLQRCRIQRTLLRTGRELTPSDGIFNVSGQFTIQLNILETNTITSEKVVA